MRFLLDTDISSYVIKQHPVAVERFKDFAPRDMAISVVTYAELCYGAARKAGRRYQDAVETFGSYIKILDWPKNAAIHYGDIRAQLEAAGTPIGEIDTQIAAHALALKCVLVTNNQKHFRRVPGLKLENWLV